MNTGICLVGWHLRTHVWKEREMAETWLSSLKTATPQEGFELATKLARVGVKLTQPSAGSAG